MTCIVTTLYNDLFAQERDQKYHLNIDGLKMKSMDDEEEGGFFGYKKHKIQLFHPNTRSAHCCLL